MSNGRLNQVLLVGGESARLELDLLPFGLASVAVDNANEAVARLKTGAFPLVVVAAGLPDMTGPAFIEGLLRHFDPSTVVLFGDVDPAQAAHLQRSPKVALFPSSSNGGAIAQHLFQRGGGSAASSGPPAAAMPGFTTGGGNQGFPEPARAGPGFGGPPGFGPGPPTQTYAPQPPYAPQPGYAPQPAPAPNPWQAAATGPIAPLGAPPSQWPAPSSQPPWAAAPGPLGPGAGYPPPGNSNGAPPPFFAAFSAQQQQSMPPQMAPQSMPPQMAPQTAPQSMPPQMAPQMAPQSMAPQSMPPQLAPAGPDRATLERLEALANELAQSSAEVVSLQQRLVSAEQAAREAQERSIEREARLAEAVAVASSLRGEVDAARRSAINQVAEVMALSDEGEPVSLELDDVKARLEAVDAERVGLQQQLVQQRAERDWLTNELVAAQQQAQERALELEGLRQQALLLQTDRDRLAAEMFALNHQAQDSSLELDDLRRQSLEGHGLQQQIDGLVLERDALTAERDLLRLAHDEVVAERGALNAERDMLLAEQEVLLGERARLGAESETLRAEHASLRQQLREAHAEIEQQQAAVDTAEKNAADLEEQLGAAGMFEGEAARLQGELDAIRVALREKDFERERAIDQARAETRAEDNVAAQAMLTHGLQIQRQELEAAARAALHASQEDLRAELESSHAADLEALVEVRTHQAVRAALDAEKKRADQVLTAMRAELDSMRAEKADIETAWAADQHRVEELEAKLGEEQAARLDVETGLRAELADARLSVAGDDGGTGARAVSDNAALRKMLEQLTHEQSRVVGEIEQLRPIAAEVDRARATVVDMQRQLEAALGTEDVDGDANKAIGEAVRAHTRELMELARAIEPFTWGLQRATAFFADQNVDGAIDHVRALQLLEKTLQRLKNELDRVHMVS